MVEQRSWHQKTWEETLSELRSHVERGLDAEEVNRRLQTYGHNQLERIKPTHPLVIFANQFRDFMIYVLLLAAFISGVLLKEYIDMVVIMAIVIANAALGFVQEYRAEKALVALKKLSAPTVRVRREGRVEIIPAKDLVPGDIILIEEGDRIAADARLISVSSLKMGEASLTGEAEAIAKVTHPLREESLSPGDRVNMVFQGTYAEKGRGTAIVVETGMRTEMGKIARMIEEAEEAETPLQKGLKVTGKRIALLCLTICAFIFVFGLLKGEEWTSLFLFSVSLAVAAIPEGLPAIVTIALSIGVRKMAEENAILRRLPAVETLGCTNVICTDKTGTLTRSEMEVQEIWIEGEETIELRGEEEKERALFSAQGVLLISSLCNDAWAQEGEYIGEGTEVALLKMADCLGFDRSRMERDFPRIGELPFESERKMMSTIHRVDEPATMEGVFSFRDSSYLLFSKGAPEIIVRLCNRIALPGGIASLTPETSSLLLAEAEGMAERGLRTLAFAYRPLKEVPEELDSSNLERELVFAGLVGMNDPPRPEVFDALNSCRSAHIEVVMITGDHAVTARAIGQELGILSPEKETLTGSELSAIPEEELERRVHRIGVYARVAPFDKVKIVKAWKARDAVVAMTGDGVNDAPALKHADIGIAMGITGTDVSKEASDMVLADDNFATIVKAVREGRIIYDNMKKFIYFLLSCNISEVITMFVAMLFTTQTPLRAVQILWINLITDGFPALALGVDTPAPGIMTRPPRDPREKILSLRKQVALLWQGMILAMGALTCFFLTRYWLKLDEASIQTAVFCTLVFSQLMHTYNCRSEEVSFWRLSFFDNRALPAAIAVSLSLQIAVIALPPLMRAFGTSRLVGSTWILIIACALAPVLLIDRIKVLIQKTRERKTGIGK